MVKQIRVSGMTCSGCERKIERKLKALVGVAAVSASYSNGLVVVTYDENKVELAKIKQLIEMLDYQVVEDGLIGGGRVNYLQLAIIGLVLLGGSLIIRHFGGFDFFNYFPQVQTGISYVAIFIIGLLTSVHCVGMCGGICLAQCVGVKGSNNIERLRPAFLYNFGRIISYTFIGAIVGAIGAVISFNGVMRGAVALFAGSFMVIMGLNMLNIFPWLRKLNLKMPRFLTGGIAGKSNSPLYVGLLNGLMPCGPLQAMQLYALSTGSFIQGAISMFLFALGTSILMFSFGALSSLLSKKFTAKLMAVSAVLVIILGVGMFNTGISMAGFVAVGTVKSDTKDFKPVLVDGYQIVEIEVGRRSYGAITVKKGIPVKFNLHAEAANINSCNNAIMIPAFGIEMAIEPGDNIVEFLPEEVGVIPYSCWMNMIRSSISVVE